MQEITENIYCVQGLRMGRVYVIEGGDGLTLIDTSMRNARAKIEQQLQAHGHQLSEVKHILITHAHPDHIGSLADIKQATGAMVYVHRRDAPTVRTGLMMPPPENDKPQSLTQRLMTRLGSSMRMPSAEVGRELQEGDTLDEVLPGMCVVDTPGHSPGHVSFWLPEKRLLFCGDVTMRLFGRLRLPIAAFTTDMAEDKRSVRKIADMDVDILCLGHGQPIIGGASAVLREFAGKIGV